MAKGNDNKKLQRLTLFGDIKLDLKNKEDNKYNGVEPLKIGDLILPRYMKNKRGTMYIAFTDLYRFIRIDIAKEQTHSHWNLQLGLHYGYGITKYEDKKVDDELFFIKRALDLNIEIQSEEFFDKVGEYEKWFNEFQNFFEMNKPGSLYVKYEKKESQYEEPPESVWYDQDERESNVMPVKTSAELDKQFRDEFF